MKKVLPEKNKITLLLISAILMLCIAFIIVACGVGPPTKSINTQLGNCALDFSNCPDTDACTASFTTANFQTSLFEGRPLTFEAWVKPKSTSTGIILQRFASRGAKLSYSGWGKDSTSCDTATPTVFTFTSNHLLVVGDEIAADTALAGCGIAAATKYYVCSVPTTTTMTVDDVIGCGSPVASQAGSTTDIAWKGVNPTFTIRRTISSIAPTSTVTYGVTSLTSIALNTWSHVAGILANTTHSHTACTDSTGAQADSWHIDIYLNGVYSDCTETWNGNTSAITKTSASCDSATPTVFTFESAHEFTVGEPATLTASPKGDAATDCGISAGTYYVCTVPTTTTMTVDNDIGCGSPIGTQTGGTADHNIAWIAPAVADPTIEANAYAHEPAGHTSGPGRFSGVIDEARVWNVERTITTCMNQALKVAGGACDVDSNDLITYHSLNTCSGHFVYDNSGNLGLGALDYPDTNNSGFFLEWSTGWTTDTPF